LDANDPNIGKGVRVSIQIQIPNAWRNQGQITREILSIDIQLSEDVFYGRRGIHRKRNTLLGQEQIRHQ
jgi:hypothetical protein